MVTFSVLLYLDAMKGKFTTYVSTQNLFRFVVLISFNPLSERYLQVMSKCETKIVSKFHVVIFSVTNLRVVNWIPLKAYG